MTLLRPLAKNLWRLEEDVAVSIPGIGTITVNQGHETDLASIPWPLWSIVGHPAQSEFIEPAIIHDYLCEEAWGNGDYQLRVIADAIFFYLLRDQGVCYLHRSVMYAGVRWWGWISYWGRRKQP